MSRSALIVVATALSPLGPAPLRAQPLMRGTLAAIPSASARAATAGVQANPGEYPHALPPGVQLEVSLPAGGGAYVDDKRTPWYAPLASAIVPGAGQGLLRQQRGVAYLAAESYLILQVLQSQRDASREKREYRDIARTVARAGVPGERPDGPWSYYERMQRVLESGAYNQTPGAGFTPESDPETFNGSIWLLARETYWRDPETAPSATSPEYQRAISFYQSRAATDEFLWSWRDAQLQQDLFRQTIARSNESARRTRQMVGLLLANHALSLVDAYVSVRLRVFGTDPASGVQQVGISGSIPMPSVRR